MAQNVTIMGASYSAVPAVTLPKTGGGTARFDDASVTTATASDVASGKIFLASNGTITTGTASSGGIIAGDVWQDADGYVHLSDEPGAQISVTPLSVTVNGTYTAPTGSAYSPVTVSVSGGGSPSVEGLEYEEGLVTVSSTSPYTISFSNTHTTLPLHFTISHNSQNDSGVWYESQMLVETFCFNDLIGVAPMGLYGNTIRIYANASGSRTLSYAYLNYPSTEMGNSTVNHPRYWATETGIKLYGSSSMMLSGEYKWIAVWAPTE